MMEFRDEEFWEVVDELQNASPGDSLRNRLLEIGSVWSLKKIMLVDFWSRKYVSELNRLHLYVFKGCLEWYAGDDPFGDFRWWIVFHGKEFFDRMRDPCQKDWSFFIEKANEDKYYLEQAGIFETFVDLSEKYIDMEDYMKEFVSLIGRKNLNEILTLRKPLGDFFQTCSSCR